MFPTAYKDKIPKTLSYPVKAKLISEELDGMLPEEEVHLTFSTYWALYSIKRGAPCEVISVSYSYHKASQYTPHRFEELEKEKPKWTINVEAIPNTISYHVTELLQKEAFPKIREWLHSQKDITGKSASAWFAAIYNEEMDGLEYKEHLYW